MNGRQVIASWMGYFHRLKVRRAQPIITIAKHVCTITVIQLLPTTIYVVGNQPFNEEGSKRQPVIMVQISMYPHIMPMTPDKIKSKHTYKHQINCIYWTFISCLINFNQIIIGLFTWNDVWIPNKIAGYVSINTGIGYSTSPHVAWFISSTKTLSHRVFQIFLQFIQCISNLCMEKWQQS